MPSPEKPTLALDLDASLPSAGTVLSERYLIDSVLGEGGMCFVYRARRLHLDDHVAIKLLRPEMASEKILVERFLREGRAVASIRSEHVVRVIDVERLPNGSPYLVLEYLEGTDLDAHLASEGPLEIATAVDLVLQACEAIAEAHEAGIVHRDLKPANLFLSRFSDGSPWIKVLDFGISKVVRSNSLHDIGSMDASVLGSPRYMAPEQVRASRDMDHRVDIWALGTILYELLAGRTPSSRTRCPSFARRSCGTSPRRSSRSAAIARAASRRSSRAAWRRSPRTASTVSASWPARWRSSPHRSGTSARSESSAIAATSRA